MRKLLRPRYWCSALAIGLAISAFTPEARAALPGGGTQAIPVGLADFMAGVLPPPGYYWLNYLAYVNKNALLDDGGEKVEVPGLGKTKLKAHVVAEAARFVWMSPYKLFGATYGAQVIFTGYHADLKLKAGPATLINDHFTGLSDITVNPIILAWHFSPNFHMGAGLDIVLPAGKYDTEHPASLILNSNVLTFEPLVAISYWQPGGIDISAKIKYDFHGPNKDYKNNLAEGPFAPTREVTPGQEFHFDWGASWGFGGSAPDELRAGLAGFCYWQTTPDVIDGEKADSDTKMRQFAIGPAFKWWPKMGPLSVEGKAMWEFGTRNGAQGYSVWLNSIFAF